MMPSQPVGPHFQMQRNSGRFAFRVNKRYGGRQIIFLPLVVLTLARGEHSRRMLTAEVESGRHAERSDFWSGLAAPAWRFGRSGILRRRFRPAGTADFDGVAELLEHRLDAARHYPATPMLAEVVRRGMFLRLEAHERARLVGALAAYHLPATTMHGDLHLFNFVRSDDGYRLIDWEHFHEHGSFVYDYLDFHLSARRIGTNKPWHRVLSEIEPDHPCIRTASQNFGIDPRALLAYYVFVKSDTIIARSAEPDLHWDSKFAPLLTCLCSVIAKLDPIS